MPKNVWVWTEISGDAPHRQSLELFTLARGLGTAAAVVLPKAMAYATVAGLPVAVRILARLVDIERVVCVLHQRYAQAAPGEERDQLLDQRRLAAAGKAGESEPMHGGFPRMQPMIPSTPSERQARAAMGLSRRLARAGAVAPVRRAM